MKCQRTSDDWNAVVLREASLFSRNSLAMSVNLAGCLAKSRRTHDGKQYADAKRIDH